MNICENKNGNICKMLSAARGDFVHIPDSFCQTICDNGNAKEKALAYLEVPDYDLANIETDYAALLAGDTSRKAEFEAKIAQYEAENKRLLKDLPAGFDLAKNLHRHLREILAYYKKTGRMKVSDAQQAKRLEICRSCPSGKMVIKDGTMRCTHKNCGCHLDNPSHRPLLGGKAEYAALNCDLGHWAEVDKNASF